MTSDGVVVSTGDGSAGDEPLWALADDERRLVARWLAGRYLSATYDGAWDLARVLLAEFDGVWPAPRAGDGRGGHGLGCGGVAGGCAWCGHTVAAIDAMVRTVRRRVPTPDVDRAHHRIEDTGVGSPAGPSPVGAELDGAVGGPEVRVGVSVVIGSDGSRPGFAGELTTTMGVDEVTARLRASEPVLVDMLETVRVQVSDFLGARVGEYADPSAGAFVADAATVSMAGALSLDLELGMRGGGLSATERVGPGAFLVRVGGGTLRVTVAAEPASADVVGDAGA